MNDCENNVEIARVKSIIESCDGVNNDKISYELMDLNRVAKVEYMLWFMDFEMNEYIDDWRGPHSLLVTSYLCKH